MNTNTYIAFMDLLGSKAKAISEPQKYRFMIRDFQNTVQELYHKRKQATIKVYVFSDCAYFECDNFIALLTFLGELREKLLVQGIFFNAAICEGKLEDKIVGDKKDFSMVDFWDSRVVKVYSLQSCFSGAGIYIDPDLRNNNKIKKSINELCVKSIYINIDRFSGKKTFSQCIDVKFQRNSLELLRYILNVYIRCYIQDIRASRYYFTLFVTYIEEQSIDVFAENDMECIKEIIRMTERIEKFEDRCIFLLKLIDRLYEAQKENSKKSDDLMDPNKALHYMLDYIYEETKLYKLYNIKEYSREVISDSNKALLAEFCFWKKINYPLDRE